MVDLRRVPLYSLVDVPSKDHISAAVVTGIPGDARRIPLYPATEVPTIGSITAATLTGIAGDTRRIPMFSPGEVPVPTTASALAVPGYVPPDGGGPLPTLGPTTASFTVGATAGSTITTITGLSAGETVTSISPNDGRVSISSGNALVVGLTASSTGTISYTLATSLGRILTIAVTANAAVLPTPVLIDGFESLTGFAGSGGAALTLDTVRKVQGTSALNIEGSGVSGANPIATKAGAFTGDPSTFGVVAYYLNLQSPNAQNQLSMQFGRSGSYGNHPPAGLSGFPLGGRWLAYDASEFTGGAGLPTGSALTDFRFRETSQNAPYNLRASVDALVRNAKGRATIVIGFDDGFREAYDAAFSYMQPRGIPGTLYLPWTRISDGARISGYLLTSEVQTMVNAGWAACLDGTGDDTAMTLKADTTAVVSELQAGQAWLAARGFDAEGGKHFCYPNGYWRGDANGSPAPFVQVAAMAGNGSTTVTFGAAAAVTNGMTCFGKGVPAGTTVISGGGASTTSVVLSNTIPTQTLAAGFQDQTGVFAEPKMPNALAAAGFKSGRTTIQDNMFTRLGFADQALIMPAKSTSAATLATLQPQIDRAILRGETIELYIHQITGTGGGINMLTSDFQAVIDYIKGRIDAGVLTALTKPQLYARDVNGLATHGV